MSLQSELTRLQDNVTSISSSKDDIMAALASKGVTVPAGATLHDVPRLIGQIDGMGPVGHVTIGGRTYKTVKIGTQEWMAENLDYKFQVNGSTIPIGASGTPSTPAAWYYNNYEATYGIDGTYKCGLLYNWYAVKYLDDNKATLLPDGWHVPSTTEWDNLANEIGGASSGGTKLKALDNSVTSNWPSNWNGTNDYGFSALPAGYYGGVFDNIGTRFVVWSVTQVSSTAATRYKITNSDANIMPVDDYKANAMSVRLVKDVP
jgi:uncharacterized protein (TIGR02145 family)